VSPARSQILGSSTASRRGAATTPSSRVNTGGSSGTTTEDAVALVLVNSEHELLAELTAIRSKLEPGREWDERIAALKRLHGIVLGGASAYASFLEHLKGSLRDPLKAQLTDRRSQVHGPC
jgi:CLIP-associating protein 1/2